jgi:hypothetical protein
MDLNGSRDQLCSGKPPARTRDSHRPRNHRGRRSLHPQTDSMRSTHSHFGHMSQTTRPVRIPGIVTSIVVCSSNGPASFFHPRRRDFPFSSHYSRPSRTPAAWLHWSSVARRSRCRRSTRRRGTNLPPRLAGSDGRNLTGSIPQDLKKDEFPKNKGRTDIPFLREVLGPFFPEKGVWIIPTTDDGIFPNLRFLYQDKGIRPATSAWASYSALVTGFLPKKNARSVSL